MTPTLEAVLVLFIIIVIVVLVILTIHIVKFLKETTQTMTSIKELTDITKKEIEPALKSLNGILDTVNNVSKATNKQFDLVKKILTTVLGASCMAFNNVKKGGFISGLISGFNIFRKKGK